MKNLFSWLGISLCVCLMLSCGDDADEGEVRGNGSDITKEVKKTKVSGTIEKGPFVQGSKVTLYELNADLSQTGKSFKTETKTDLGDFAFDASMTLSSQFVELETTGFFYNELKGQWSATQISLMALADVSDKNAVNVNLLTHLEYARVKKLVREGTAFANAKKQAERELLACFAITDEIDSPEKISITDNNKNSSILLAISSVLLYDKSEADFSRFIAQLSTHFADYGRITDVALREKIDEGLKHISPKKVAETMVSFYKDKGVALQVQDFGKYVDFNADGVIDENDKEVVPDNISVVEEQNFSENLLPILSSVYMSVAAFEDLQQNLENRRFNGESILPSDHVVSQAFAKGYEAVVRAAMMIEHGDQNRDAQYIAEARALRAFVYYNMVVLWGNVPLITRAPTIDDNGVVPQSDAKEVLYFAQDEMRRADDFLLKSDNQGHLDWRAAQLLQAEIALTLGQQDKAGLYLGRATSDVDFSLRIPEKTLLSIYTSSYLDVLKKELKGDVDGLENAGIGYGRWALLKRIGKAQVVARCADFQLLMPFPLQELNKNYMLKQNEGY